ncbi:beta-lactamase-like protein [Xylariales sp. PMI_506]|nr:beta-lactamase-like protein [Xylariales sp. PMI_506]
MQDLKSYEPSFDDRQDFDDADRGFIAALTPGVIKNSEGKVVWDIDAYAFMQEPCPSTAHPHLWRQGQLNSKQGLYEITPGIYQIRALDLSNMTIVEGKEGIIIIDPLISCECAAAGLKLYQEHRGNTRKVTGMIYSHSHGDHYMGAQGVLPPDQDMSIPIIAPEGFMEAVMSESIIAGPAMRKRGAFMYGNALPRGPKGQIGTGLGMASSVGTTSLIPPNLLIQKTGEEHVVDGVRIVFQMVPGTEAPAEVNFHFPDFRALCIPETATNCMHNVVTLRGAQVRDAKAWSGYLDEAVVLFGADSDLMFCSHNWPTWGQKELVSRLTEQRDMYGYLHDQTVRMMNLGMTGIEIAEKIRMPPTISRAWHCRGFYGSISHNVKGIYQKYMTWFDGDPAHLWQYPPAEEGKRYVECMGGVEALSSKAEDFIARGDYRFAATLLAHAIAAEPDNKDSPARPLLATAYEQLGYGAENATWRNFYLTGAQELRTGKKTGILVGGRTALGPNLSVDQWFEILCVQLDGERAAAADAAFAIDFDVVDVKQKWRLIVSNGVLTRRLLAPDVRLPGSEAGPDLAMVLTRANLLDVLRGQEPKVEKQEGRIEVLNQLLDLISIKQESARGPSQI